MIKSNGYYLVLRSALPNHGVYVTRISGRSLGWLHRLSRRLAINPDLPAIPINWPEVVKYYPDVVTLAGNRMVSGAAVNNGRQGEVVMNPTVMVWGSGFNIQTDDGLHVSTPISSMNFPYMALDLLEPPM